MNFGPGVGGEIQKQRPAVIVSNDITNKFLNRIQVVPLTSQVDRIYPSEASVMLDGKKHKAMAYQIMTVSKNRLSNLEGKLSASDMKKVEKAIKTQLEL